MEKITVKDTALILGVTKATVYNWIKAGIIPAVKYGRKTIRLNKDDVIAYANHGNQHNDHIDN